MGLLPWHLFVSRLARRCRPLSWNLFQPLQTKSSLQALNVILSIRFMIPGWKEIFQNKEYLSVLKVDLCESPSHASYYGCNMYCDMKKVKRAWMNARSKHYETITRRLYFLPFILQRFLSWHWKTKLTSRPTKHMERFCNPHRDRKRSIQRKYVFPIERVDFACKEWFADTLTCTLNTQVINRSARAKPSGILGRGKGAILPVHRFARRCLFFNPFLSFSSTTRLGPRLD